MELRIDDNNLFTAVFFNYIVGVSAINKYNSPEQQKEEIKLKIFRGMGFDSAQEYVNLYPGKFLISSQECKEALQSHGYSSTLKKFEEDDVDNIATFNKFYRFEEDTSAIAIKRTVEFLSYEEYTPSFVVQPTIQEIINTGCYDKRYAYFLWFCEDWKEDA